ncbi:MAG: hypothetical protein CMH53_09580 [Myxococcales bacterium]|nr:hypothetical protein [Myxococcales bacterium]
MAKSFRVNRRDSSCPSVLCVWTSISRYSKRIWTWRPRTSCSTLTCNGAGKTTKCVTTRSRSLSSATECSVQGKTASQQSDARRQAESWVTSRNDSYLHSFVEAFGVCPYAARCRTDGKLLRKISWIDDPEQITSRLLPAVDALESAAQQHEVEVALLVCPSLSRLSAARFSKCHEALRSAYEQRHRKPAFYVVPFHPDQRHKVISASGLVPFWRRSPDATFQFVSVDLLHRLRRGDQQRDPSHLALQLAASGLPPEEILRELERMPHSLSTSERVASNNLLTFRQHHHALEDALDRVAVDDFEGIMQADWVDSTWQVVQ